MSDHSSHLDSVSGTAIHLGRNSRASSSERGGGGHIQVVPLHHPVGKMSSLAKDAQECGPGLTRDSTLTRPAVPSSAAASSSTARKKGLNRFGFSFVNEAFITESSRADEDVTETVSAASNITSAANDVHSQEQVTNGDNLPKMPPRDDAMMTSIYQAAPQEKDQVNGSKAVPEEANPVPGTSLKCLEDPQFSFDGGANANAVAPQPKPRKPTYKGWVGHSILFCSRVQVSK